MDQVNSTDVLRSRITDFWSKHARSFWAPVKLVASILPGGEVKVEMIENELLGSDLNISPLTAGNRIRPLSGLKLLTLQQGKKVFPEGFNISFTCSHNEKGSETILFREMSLIVEEFTPGVNEHYNYNREGEKIIGAGIVQPWCFLITVRGKEVLVPYWMQAQTEKPVRGAIENFFETEPPRLFSFSKGEQFIQEFVGTIRTIKAGFYKFRFRFGYSIGGRTDITYFSVPILVYNGEVPNE